MTVHLRTVTKGVTATGTLHVAVPAGTATGDLLVLFAFHEGARATAPTGWTVLTTASTATWSVVCAAYVVPASVPATVRVVASNGLLAVMLACAYSTSALTLADIATKRSGSGTGDTLTVSGLTAAPLLIWAAMAYRVNTRASLPPPPGFSTLTTTSFLNGFCQEVLADLSPSSGTSYSATATAHTPPQWTAAAVGITAPSAPSAPTLLTPPNGAYLTAASVVALKARYNSTDGASANAYAAEVKLSTAASYSYWNASTNALQSTVVWNTASVATGADLSISLPNTAVSNGHSYSWSMAFQESLANLQGPFATPFAFTAQAPPALTVTAPSGTVTTGRPTVAWTATPSSGASIIKYRVVLYTAAQYGITGFTPGVSPSTWDSGALVGSASSLVVGVTLTSGTAYRAYVQVTETGTEKSAWAYTSFTASFEVPLAPTVSATATTTSATDYPVVKLTVQTHDNLLTATSAAPVSGTGQWVAASGCTVGKGVPPVVAPVGADAALSMKATAAGTMVARTSTGVAAFSPVVAGATYTVTGAFLAGTGTTGKSCHLVAQWCKATGAVISASDTPTVTDSTSAWARSLGHLTAPATAARVYLEAVVETAAATQTHWVANMGVLPGSVTTWAPGGFVGNTQLVVTRSDGLYLRGASTLNPVAVPAAQTLLLYDYECIPGTEYYYSVVERTTGPTLASSPAGTSNTAEITTVGTGWWEIDPTDPSSAVHAQIVSWQPVQTEQSAAHMVMGQFTMNMVANAMMNQDFAATFLTLDPTTYTRLVALLRSQRIVWISSPFSALDCGYFRFGPQTGGLSTGAGNKSRTGTLEPSSAGSPYRKISVTAIAQPRPVP